MPTVVAGSHDGWAASPLLGTYAGARSHAGDGVGATSSYDIVAVWHYYASRRGKYGIRRAFFDFDTTSITVAPSAATFKVYGMINGSGDIIAVKTNHVTTLVATTFYDAFDHSPAAQTALDNSDGSGAGTFAGISGLAYSAAIDTWSTSGYNDIALNATALADMASEDTFNICLMNYDHDYLDVDGTASEQNGMRFYENGDGKWPYIDYTAGTTAADNATFFGANF